jgi:hypothetical protein
MAKASPIIAALNAGEWSPLLFGRVDIVGYAAAAYRCENFMPLVQGPVTRRGGTRHVTQAKDSSTRAWLMPFIKARNDAWQIEFSPGFCRFYTNRAPVLTGSPKTITGATAATPIVITSASHGYANGDDVFITGVVGMTQINGRWFKVAGQTTNTFQLTSIHGTPIDGTGYGAYVSGGVADKPYQIVSPFTVLETDMNEFALDFVQSGDVIYIVDRAGLVEPKKLSRSGATSWAFSNVNPRRGPWEPVNATATTMYVSAADGTITITASTSIFTAADIGRRIRIDQENLTATPAWKTATAYSAGDHVRSEGKEYEALTGGTSGTTIPAHTKGAVSDGGVEWQYRSSGYGLATITAQAGTTATATVQIRFPKTIIGSGNVSALWRLGAYYIGNYPTSVAFFRERLAFGMGQRIDLSVSSDFENFAIDVFGEILPESAVTAYARSGSANEIVGMVDKRSLIVATGGGEFVLDAQTTSEPFGPNNIRVSNETEYGSRPIRPIRVGENVMVVQGSGRRVRAMQYSFDVEGFIAPDMTVRSEHIVKPGVVAMARQESPFQTFWFVRGDGVLLSFAYDTTQEVRGWARHTLGGGGIVEAVSVIPSPDGERDDLWLTVRRTINGATRRYVEIMAAEYEDGDERAEVCYADSSLTYSGASATIIHGLDHLEGQTIGLLIDGAAAPDAVVANGAVTMARAGLKAVIGYRVTAAYATMTIEAGAGDGTSQAKTKRLTDVAFRVVETLGGKAGPDLNTLDDIPDLTWRAPATPMGQAPAFMTGDALIPWPGGNETNGRIWYVNDTMFPATIAAIMPQVVTQEGR